ncbi:hypothetical protein A7982_12652 [Minicystis rosea]|nr:hypothetical protein A7982_12652 [Minicystis rosea]
MQRQAFRKQFTRAHCSAAGASAEGAAVLAEALGWLPLIEDALARYPRLVRRYGRTRFAWMLECVWDLWEAKERQEAPSEGMGTPSRRSARARDAAMCARDDLILAISVLAEGDKAEHARLAPALGDAESPEALAASLHVLARLAGDWLEREDHAARALVASIDLTVADVEVALAAAHAVISGNGVPEAHDEGQDPPAVHLATGRVLLEMGLARHVFERAHQWDERVPQLVPGPASLVVLAA